MQHNLVIKISIKQLRPEIRNRNQKVSLTLIFQETQKKMLTQMLQSIMILTKDEVLLHQMLLRLDQMVHSLLQGEMIALEDNLHFLLTISNR